MEKKPFRRLGIGSAILVIIAGGLTIAAVVRGNGARTVNVTVGASSTTVVGPPSSTAPSTSTSSVANSTEGPVSAQTPSTLTLPTVAVAPLTRRSAATGSADGSPTTPIATCAATATPQPAITITLSDAQPGFTSGCYAVSSSSATITLIDNMTNAQSGLTNPMEFTVSTATAPVVGDAQNTVGVTGVTPIPVTNLGNALFISPTAPDINPVVFQLANLQPGEYLLQLPNLPTAPGAVLTIT